MLYVVPTPIGNLDDITIRSLKLFKSANTIISEDPRITSQLLKKLEIEEKPKFIQITKNQNFNYNQIKNHLEELVFAQNENSQTSTKLNFLEETPKIRDSDPLEGVSSPKTLNITLLVSDAGTPGISDPGVEIIKICQEIGLKYTILPGATALIPAVAASGFVSKEFLFLGFLPTKKGRQKIWKMIQNSEFPIIIYESVHRIEKFIEEAQKYLSENQKISISREISKQFEEHLILEIKDLKDLEIKKKGEFVICISPTV